MSTPPPFLSHASIKQLAHATAIIGASKADAELFVAELAVSPYDTVSLDAHATGGIREVRLFTNELLTAPQYGNVRLGVVWSADELSVQAQNALLKFLEEPPARVRLILFIGAESSMLPTVLSRCRKYYAYQEAVHTEGLPAYSKDTLQQFIASEDLAKDENINAAVAAWLQERYRAWCASGRPAQGVDELERFWQCYRGLQTQTSKRLLLEQLVVSSL